MLNRKDNFEIILKRDLNASAGLSVVSLTFTTTTA